MQPIEELTDDELRVKCAKACGWTDIKRIGGDSVWEWVGDRPNSNRHEALPSYPSDLSACAEMESHVTDWWAYSDALQEVTDTGAVYGRNIIQATARQRCIVFLSIRS